jgi:hypothetical protein
MLSGERDIEDSAAGATGTGRGWTEDGATQLTGDRRMRNAMIESIGCRRLTCESRLTETMAGERGWGQLALNTIHLIQSVTVCTHQTSASVMIVDRSRIAHGRRKMGKGEETDEEEEEKGRSVQCGG